LWRIGTDGGDAVQLTNGPKGESSPRWSPDGQRVAFTATRDTNITQVYVIANGGGEARSVTHHATSVSNIVWSPAGDAIYFVAEEPKTKEARDRERLKD